MSKMVAVFDADLCAEIHRENRTMRLCHMHPVHPSPYDPNVISVALPGGELELVVPPGCVRMVEEGEVRK